VLILFGLVEMAIGAPLWLWIGAMIYALARIAHGFGMDADKPPVWRAGGALLTTGRVAVSAESRSAEGKAPAHPYLACQMSDVGFRQNP